MAPAPAGCTRGWNLYIVHADRIINICLHFIPKYLDRIFPNSSMPVRQSAPSELKMKMFWSLSSLVPFYLARISVEVAKTDKNNYPCSRGLCWLLTRLFRQVEIANLSRPSIKFYEAVIIKCVLGWRRQINVRGGAASFCEAVSGGHPWHGTPGTGGGSKDPPHTLDTNKDFCYILLDMSCQ